jgi:hypothetical protein
MICRIGSAPPYDCLRRPPDKRTPVCDCGYRRLLVAGFAQRSYCLRSDQSGPAGEQWREDRKVTLRKGHVNRSLSRSSPDGQIGIVQCRVE